MNEELEIKDAEVFLEGDHFKIFSSLKKNEDVKNEKILFLYEDKIKIISKQMKKDFSKKIKIKKIKKLKKIRKIRNQKELMKYFNITQKK